MAEAGGPGVFWAPHQMPQNSQGWPGQPSQGGDGGRATRARGPPHSNLVLDAGELLLGLGQLGVSPPGPASWGPRAVDLVEAGRC